MKTTYCALLLAVFSLAFTASLEAGSKNRTGTGGASELTIPIGARSIAMGNATVAMARGIDALFFNPAGAARDAIGTTLYASHMSYIADIGVDCGAVSVPVSSLGVISLQLVGFSVGEIMMTTTDLPDGFGATFAPQFFTGGLTYSTQLTDRISIGITATLISESMASVSATGFALSAGAIYENLGGIDGLALGLVLKNVGPQMRFDGSGLNVKGSVPGLDRPPYFYKVDAASFELPSSFEMGLGYRGNIGEDHAVTFSAAFQNNNFSDDAYRVGAEYGFQKTVFVRGGYEYSPSPVDQRDNVFGPTFGMGLHANVSSVDVMFDYAYRSVKFFGGNHVFSLTLGL
jgi:opacity protein-like surface antigen